MTQAVEKSSLSKLSIKTRL